MNKLLSSLKQREIGLSYWLLTLVMAIGYVAGLFVTLMDNDSAHHASIALNMFQHNDWASLVGHGEAPYLDKPHFQFWLVAIGYKLFGVGGVAYKISSFLFTLAGLWATYKLTTHLKDKLSGIYATLLLASSAAFALANIDVRMDAILTAAIIIAIWQGVMHLDTGKFRNLTLAALGLAMAFGTKGWIGVMVPFFALFFYAAGKKQLRWFISWKFPALLVLFAIFISPVLYAYYLQFDLHPELIISGKDHNSGVLFILWNQVFARMGGGYGTTSKDYFFFLHTMLWAILPWSFLFYTLAFKEIREFIKKKKEISPIYWLTLPAILLTMVALSVSEFKLPHYLNVTFPLIAIFLACSLTELQSRKFIRGIGVMQKIIVGGLLIAVVLVNVVCFPSQAWWFNLLLAAGILYNIYLLFYQTGSINNIIKTGVFLSGVVWFSLNLNFYPQLMTYQAGNEIAIHTVVEKQIPVEEIGTFQLRDFSYSFDIYAGKVIEECPESIINERLENHKNVYLLTESEGIETLKTQGYALEIIDQRRDYHITRLKAKFMNPATREQMLTQMYLIKVLSGPQK